MNSVAAAEIYSAAAIVFYGRSTLHLITLAMLLKCAERSCSVSEILSCSV